MRLPRISPRQYRWITLSALVALAAIVVTGAAVRLTGSGLGCSDWPRCTRNELVGVADFHQQVEQVNRLFTGAISIVIIVAVLGSLARDPRRRDLVRWSLGLAAGLVGQIVLGGVTVIFELQPPIVMAHFLLSAVLVWNAVVLHRRAGQPDTPAVATVPAGVVTTSRAMVAAGAAVLLTGTVVTGTGPHGGDEHVRRLSFDIEQVARVHSLTAWCFLGLAIATLWSVHRHGATPAAHRAGVVLVGAIVAQGAVGYTQYALGVPPGLVLVHITGSVVVWIAAISFHLSLFAHPEEAGPSAEVPGQAADAPRPAGAPAADLAPT